MPAALTPECRVFLVVVTNVSQGRTPRPDKLVETGGDLVGTHQPHPADGDGRVLQQRLGRVGPVDDRDQGLQQNGDVGLHFGPELDRYLAWKRNNK